MAPVFGKNLKNLPFSSIRAGARDRHPDDRAAISHPLYSGFFGKRSEKNGLFLKKVFDRAYLSSRTYAKNRETFHPFSEKTFHTVYSKNSANDQFFSIFRPKTCSAVVTAIQRAILLSSIFRFFWQTIRDFCIFLEKKSATGPLYRGYRQAGVQIGPCFLKKSEIFSGSASEVSGSNPARQPFFRVSEVSEFTLTFRADSVELFTA